METAEISEQTEVFFVVEGHPGQHIVHVAPGITVREFVDIATTQTGITELVELYLENAKDPLDPELVLVEQFSAEFVPIHVAKPGKIKTTVRYQNREAEHDFSPATTIQEITVWAVHDKKLEVQGDPSDFQLKLGETVLPPDAHLGQVAKGQKAVTLHLVFKVRPQG